MTDVESPIRRFIVREFMFQEDESVLKFDDLLLESGISVPQNFTTTEAIANLLKEWAVESHQ